ncbi:MAG: pyridoxal phosphate-dependent aminotransferase, partial [Spirochaetes bacterium]
MSLQISNRNNMMQESPIRKLAPFADRAKEKGIKVYHLNIGQPDIKTPEGMRAAYRETPEIVAYGPSAGLASYRKKLAGYYQGRGIAVSNDDVFITTGGSEAIIFSFLAALSPGDEVIVPEPFYTNYNGFAVMAGVTIVPITTTIENGFHLPAIEDFEKVRTEKTRAVLFSNPGNPTGAVFTRKALEELAEFARRYNLYIISDEAYREFTYGERQAVSILELSGLEENAILIDSVSKRYSACGARVGTLITRNTKLMEVVLKFGQARLCPPTIDQMAAEAAVDTPDDYFKEVNAEYKKRRDFAFQALSEIPGVTVKKPEGAFYIIAQLPVRDADHFAKWMLSNFSLNGATTMV